VSVNHIVTSGCSFSVYQKWPRYLYHQTKIPVYGLGQDSAGNDWISKTAIYQASKLLQSNINPEEILIVVMWSGIDRKGLFISRKETSNYDKFITTEAECPVHFLNQPINIKAKTNEQSGYILGSMYAYLGTSHARERKAQWLSLFALEEMAVESYEHFLRLQWFCKSYNIKLLNLTYGDILHYPNSRFLDPKKTGPLTKDIYESVKHLHDMIDFNQWAFYDETAGQFEYALNNKLSFYEDGHHPSLSANRHYVENFLIPILKEKALI
jgi:hypothetical protein